MVGGKRDSVSRALQKVTNIMSALGGEDSLLGHIYLTSDRHSIPVNYPQSFYKASNWEGRLLTQNPAATGLDQVRRRGGGYGKRALTYCVHVAVGPRI